MLPFFLLQKLDMTGFILYQIIQTLLNYLLFQGMAFLSRNLIFKENLEELNRTKLLLTGLINEFLYLLSSFVSVLAVFLGATALALELVIMIMIVGVVFYLRFYQKEIFNEKKTLVLFLISVIPAFIISIIITNSIFILSGIPNPLVTELL